MAAQVRLGDPAGPTDEVRMRKKRKNRLILEFLESGPHPRAAFTSSPVPRGGRCREVTVDS